MHPTLQTKLLRVLQDHSFERVGGTTTIQVDIQVISSTNRDLTQAVKDGRFREDLFFRLNVIPITLTPLRERRGDIPLLAEFFSRKHGHELKRPGLSFSPAALEALEQYDWPGNVRELENLQRAVVLASDDQIHAEELALPASADAAASTHQATARCRREGRCSAGRSTDTRGGQARRLRGPWAWPSRRSTPNSSGTEL